MANYKQVGGSSEKHLYLHNANAITPINYINYNTTLNILAVMKVE